LPQCHCMKTHHRPNRMQIDMPTTNNRLQDRIHASHCMSLPTAFQNTQYYLQAGYGLACAMASAETALLCGRRLCGSIHWGRRLCGLILLEVFLLRFGPLGASSLWLDPLGASSFAVRSFRRRVFCGSILLEACLLRFDPLGASSFAVRSFRRHVFCASIRWGRRLLRFNPFGGVSFAVRSVGVIFFAVRSFWRRVFCGSIHWGSLLCGSIGSILLETSSLRFNPFGGVETR
jgi:hypothetical protein